MADWLSDLGLGARFAFRICNRIYQAASYSYDVRTGTTNGPAHLPFCVSPSLIRAGIGMLTDCPSSTHLCLDLGPTNPMWTDLASETLGIRRSRFSRDLRYSCRHSHFCSLHRSLPYGFVACRTLPYHCRSCDLTVHFFGDVLSSFTFSAQDRLTSKLLRTF